MSVIETARRRVSPWYWRARSALAGGTTTVSVAGQSARIGATHRMEFRNAKTLLGERDHLAWLLDRLGPEARLWDIGAHLGCYSLLAADRGCRVAAVEPDPGMARRLRRNIRWNPAIADRITVREVALSAPEQQAVGVATQNTWGSDFVGEQVAISPADLAAVVGVPDAIKLDVEGMEGEVLAAMEGLLEQCHTALVEVHRERGIFVAEVRGLLDEAGFETTLAGDDGAIAYVRAEREGKR